jgi:hypothetical protein
MDWKNVVSKVAPWIGTALGGPLGGVAASAIAGVFGLDDSTEESIEAAITGASPERLLALKKADQDFSLRMQELGFKNIETLEKIAADDRDSARKANVAGGVHVTLFAMSVLLLIITLGSEVYVLFAGYPTTVPDIVVGRILGLLDAIAMTVMAYWYGTTAGSSRKTDMLAAGATAQTRKA